MDWSLFKVGAWYQIIKPSDNYFFDTGDLFRVLDTDTVQVNRQYYDGTMSLEACIKGSVGAKAVQV